MRLDHLLSKELTHYVLPRSGRSCPGWLLMGGTSQELLSLGSSDPGGGACRRVAQGAVRLVGDGHAVGSWENRPPRLWVGVFLWMAVLLPASTVRVGVWGGVCWLFENRIVDASIWTSHTCRGCVWGVLCDFVVVFLVLSDSDAPGHAACQCVGVCECSRAHGGCLGIRSR